MHLEWPQSAKMAYFNANNSSSPEIQRSDSKTPRPLPWWANVRYLVDHCLELH